MIIVLREGATPEERALVARTLAAAGVAGVDGVSEPVAAAIGNVYCLDDHSISQDTATLLASLGGVERIATASSSYQLASRQVQPEKTLVRVGSVTLGAGDPVFIAGPCSVEGEAAIFEAAAAAKAAGAHILRGGAFKPRTSPYSFQGLGLDGLRLLAAAGKAHGMPIITEVMEPAAVDAVAEHADILQIGSRNMQNYPLLRAVGRSQRPVLLKRGFAATIEEWLLAAEYILLEGNQHVIMCERGIRGFDRATRNVLDIAAVPLLARLTHLPVVVDPSHATGKRELVLSLGVAAIAAGADGVMVEMHPRPDEALSDAEQTISPETLRQLVTQGQAVRDILRDAATTDIPGEEPYDAPIPELAWSWPD